MSDPVDYKALFLQAEEERKREKLLREQAEDEIKREQLLREQAEEEIKREQLLREQAEARTRRTTFEEFIQHCHNLLSRPLETGDPSRSTTGRIPPPTGKYCPLRLEPWTDCDTRQQEIYNSVSHYLRPLRDAPRLFAPLIALEELGQRVARRPLSSEKDLESYERFAVEDHVHDIIAALCHIPSAREEFQLGDGVWFDNHANALQETPPEEPQTDSLDHDRPSRPDQFCIHRVDGNAKALLTTVEYKPPHKLSNENLRAGLRPMDFYRDIVEPETVPTDGPEKLRYNAACLTGAAIVQEYHVMIQEGLEFSYLTTGLGIVLLRVSDDSGTLYYHLCEPNLDVASGVAGPKTAVERVLCLCLMSFRSACRDQAWRNAARARLPIWESSFSYTRSQIPTEELRQTPPGSDYISPERTSSESTSEYQPSSPIEPPVNPSRRARTRSSRCLLTPTAHRQDPSDSDTEPAATARRKRGFSQIASSPPTQESVPTTPSNSSQHQTGQSRPHNYEFCTQKCLLGLQQGSVLDQSCPNVEHHRAGQHYHHHPIRASELLQMIKQQLDDNLDEHCTPMGKCGSYGAPFKVTCAVYGYTVVGKGTTSRLWSIVSEEAKVYRILQSVQGSAVPVFLGPIDLAKIYFLHGAGEIRHMLLMGWGGNSLGQKEIDATLRRAISRSKRKILALGVVHDDLRPDNILWNEELQRVLIIDFHRCHLKSRLLESKPRSLNTMPHLKRLSDSSDENKTKRMRAGWNQEPCK
ncbi:uncharacterized protein BO80DRAFT_428986 [Aspergillus ibericus CBS 121593]|uniref:Protein kinase domain-containing protein n=1 Tax=Aspergillus ibericus CBS 121593 TaxID=1448316 RepID=A0A395GMF2_9EURO|nr:hypothetical protein BO80DRAFT_428986 [Aspergillus ibericus CBS 121593]RAK96564.1 hypothetical protein BO80DRAFT_428986 [Aspergillus ibericus CBS 121593]